MKAHLPKLLEQIHSNLNSSGECIIQKIGNLEHSSLFLKLIKNHVDPQVVIPNGLFVHYFIIYAYFKILVALA